MDTPTTLPNVTTERKEGETFAIDIEYFNGMDCVQVETGYASTFALTAQTGNVYAFGSNRSLTLGIRKDIPELDRPELLCG